MRQIDLDATVAAIASELPGAAELFRRHDINFCCAGDIALSDAAVRAGLVPEELLAQLQALSAAASREAPEETSALISHILERYHETHRAELEWLIPLSQKVERVHGDHPSAPTGLSAILEGLKADLEEHMKAEEQTLFPMMQKGDHLMLAAQVAQVRDEHRDQARHLQAIEHVTHGLTLPPGACRSWNALYTALHKLIDDLVAHTHLEDQVLFPRFHPR